MVGSREKMAYPVCTAGPESLVHQVETAVMDVSEPKATGEVRDPQGQKERKEIKESLVSRALPAKKESEGRKARMEIQEHRSFRRT